MTRNTYDPLGRLEMTVVTSGDVSDTTMRSYNVRGWQTGIQNDNWSAQMRYNNPVFDESHASYTGNISEWEWSRGNTTDTYSLEYDALSRIVDSRLFRNSMPTEALSENGISYDSNGNILTLKRTGEDGSSVNNLTYHYDRNRFTCLSDGDFQSQNYTYDADGNMTFDGRTGMALFWNELGLVEKVSLDGEDLVNYSYLADGTKVSALEVIYKCKVDYMKRVVWLVAIFVSMIMTGCSPSDSRGFVKVQDGEFILDGKPLSFVGANFWYGSIIASEGRGGNRERLHKELDALKEIGVTNLRILVGSDGPEGAAYKVEPVLQPEPGVYNDTLLRGLDYLLAEMAKREMHAVLYFNNSWEWSGGYGQYLQWTGHGRCPLPVEDGYNTYVEYVRQFVMDDAAKQLYYNHVKNIITRTNTVTGKPYTEDPAIFSWQIGNEPRAFAQDSLTKANFVDWINKSAELIKSLDSNHMVSTGSEGIVGCAFDKQMLEEMHSSDAVDYVNIHIWPLVWRWVTKDTYADSIHVAMQKTEEYIAAHYPIAKRLGKPIVLEEFGYPRDGNTAFDGPVKNFWDGVSLSKDSPTSARDKYYGFVFDQLIKARKNGEPLAGVNFWGWGGHASQSPVNTFWRPGDDYCGDPAQEPQGLFSVYATDASTVELIKKTTEALAAEL